MHEQEHEEMTPEMETAKLIEKAKKLNLISTTTRPGTHYTQKFWEEIVVRNIKIMDDKDIISQAKIMMEMLYLKESPSEIMKRAYHLAIQLRDPADLKIPIAKQVAFMSEADSADILDDQAHVMGDLKWKNNPVLGSLGEVNQRIRGSEAEERVRDENLNRLNPMNWNGVDLMSEESRKTAVIWGPAIACVIVRCEKRSLESVFNKMSQLGRNLSNLYAVPMPFNELPPDSPMKQCLSALINVQSNSVDKNTLVLSFIIAYTSPDVNDSKTGLLDFLCLQSTRYTGMQLITLVDQVIKAANCTVADLIEATALNAAMKSWNSFIKVSQEYMTPSNKDQKWFYAREFDGSIFNELNFNDTWFLCEILAMLLDKLKDPKNEGISAVYEGLVAPRSNITRLGEEEERVVHEIYLYLVDKFRLEGTTDLIKKLTSRAASKRLESKSERNEKNIAALDVTSDEECS